VQFGDGVKDRCQTPNTNPIKCNTSFGATSKSNQRTMLQALPRLTTASRPARSNTPNKRGSFLWPSVPKTTVD
jgi:hypothetical protein